jgi:hypothetical protein
MPVTTPALVPPHAASRHPSIATTAQPCLRLTLQSCTPRDQLTQRPPWAIRGVEADAARNDALDDPQRLGLAEERGCIVTAHQVVPCGRLLVVSRQSLLTTVLVANFFGWFIWQATDPSTYTSLCVWFGLSFLVVGSPRPQRRTLALGQSDVGSRHNRRLAQRQHPPVRPRRRDHDESVHAHRHRDLGGRGRRRWSEPTVRQLGASGHMAWWWAPQCHLYRRSVGRHGACWAAGRSWCFSGDTWTSGRFRQREGRPVSGSWDRPAERRGMML